MLVNPENQNKSFNGNIWILVTNLLELNKMFMSVSTFPEEGFFFKLRIVNTAIMWTFLSVYCEETIIHPFIMYTKVYRYYSMV